MALTGWSERTSGPREKMYRLQNAYIQTPTTVINITNADVQVEVRHDKLSMQFESGPVAC